MSDVMTRTLRRRALAGDPEAEARLCAAVVRSGVHPLLARRPRCVLVGPSTGHSGKIHAVRNDCGASPFYLCGRTPRAPSRIDDWMFVIDLINDPAPVNAPALSTKLTWGAPTCTACIFLCLGIWRREQQRRAGAPDPSLLPRGFRAWALATQWEKIEDLDAFCAWFSDMQTRSPWVAKAIEEER